ncbi:MAG: hypothetical protein IKR57_00230 [Bacilli bacterium]|nr:hypothetical protein [Bacilli bacterium]
MRGYKVLDKGLINQYGTAYEIGKIYYLIGELEYSKNGFHFCDRPEDTLRFIEYFDSDIDMTEVECGGEIITRDDEYYGFYDLHAATIMKIIRIIPRIEYFNEIINSKNSDRVKRLASLIKLTEEEKDIILRLYPNLKVVIDYYQCDDYVNQHSKNKSLILH